MSPEIRDPRLNTAECVIEGHKPDIAATGRTLYFKAILWCSFIFVLPAGPYLTFVILDLLKQRSAVRVGDNVSLCCWCECAECCQSCNTRQDPLASSIICSCFLLFCAETGIFVYVMVGSASGNAPTEIYFILGFLVFEGAVFGCIKIFKSSDRCSMPCNSLVKVIMGICANLSTYHFCWLVIGIMISPTWGLAVLLIVGVFVSALTYFLRKIFEVDKCSHITHFIICVVSFCGVCSLVIVAVLAGQSFYGRETADDIMKTVLLYVISGLTGLKAWLSNNQTPLQEHREITREETPV